MRKSFFISHLNMHSLIIINNLFIFLCCFTSCSQDPLMVIGNNPAAGNMEVSFYEPIDIIFPADIDCTTLNEDAFFITNGVKIPRCLCCSYDVVSLHKIEIPDAGTTYTVQLTSDLKDLSDNFQNQSSQVLILQLKCKNH
jgi:hypothetical protein